MLISTLLSAALCAGLAFACDDCYGPSSPEKHTRLVRRMQPGALSAVGLPSQPLEWGQLNVLHTTDTHGWLEGHLKEHNYGADWGDFKSFVLHMRQKAKSYGVDLLVVDTGDLHDGNGLSDATTPDGKLSNSIFENIGYDLLTIGNHELYVTDVAYQAMSDLSAHYGERYLTSNVQILNNQTGKFEYIGQKYRYFTTPMGLRIMAFGLLYDFTGNTNYTQVITAANVTKEQWFLDAVMTKEPVDLFILMGHNPVRPTDYASTFSTLYSVIRKMRPTTPIQIFGGHSHIRDFAVYDTMTTGLESGRYCETLGWFSMSGLNSTMAKSTISGVPPPSMPAKNLTSGATTPGSANSMLYSRRYLDWNRQTFEYHATGSQASTFDEAPGPNISKEITADRKMLGLGKLLGCAPQTWCISCAPYLSNGSIFSLIQTAMPVTVVNPARNSTPHFIIVNTGSIRFDLVQGPFTHDDSYIVSPFNDHFVYLKNISYSAASKVLNYLNTAESDDRRRKRGLGSSHDQYTSTFTGADGCFDSPYMPHDMLTPRQEHSSSLFRRGPPALTPGYTTTDDFGTTGDDTPHSKIPDYSSQIPEYVQANASLPTSGTPPTTVDLVFIDYITSDVLAALKSFGVSKTESETDFYVTPEFTVQDYLPLYAKNFWSKGPTCPAGEGVS